jgi:hypothetical protein
VIHIAALKMTYPRINQRLLIFLQFPRYKKIERVIKMRKKCCLFLTLLCLLTQCASFGASAQTAGDPSLQAAFENDTLTLREASFIIDFTGCELRASATAYAQKAEMEGMVPSAAADGEWVSLDLDGQNFHPTAYFYSPDGSKAILMDEEHAYILKDNTITMILPNYIRSVHDGYASFSLFNKMKTSQWVGSEGITWSPDGRYAALTNFRQVFMMMRFIYGLYIIDTDTGELLCLDTYPNKINEGAASVIQTCFDASGRYLYYMLYGNINPDCRTALMRYDMETGEKLQLLACPQNTAYPRLELDPRGRLVNLTDTAQPEEFLGLNVFEQKDSVWAANAFPFSMPSANVRPQYMDIGSAGLGIMLQTVFVSGRSIMLPGRFLTDDAFTGYNELLLIEGMDAANAAVLPLSALGDGSELATKIASGEVLQCLNMKLSPDGRYALLLTTDGKTYSFMMMDLATLTLQKVQSPPEAASMRAGNGLPPSGAYLSGYNWFEGNKVVILTDDGLKLFEFALKK